MRIKDRIFVFILRITNPPFYKDCIKRKIFTDNDIIREATYTNIFLTLLTWPFVLLERLFDFIISKNN